MILIQNAHTKVQANSLTVRCMNMMYGQVVIVIIPIRMSHRPCHSKAHRSKTCSFLILLDVITHANTQGIGIHIGFHAILSQMMTHSLIRAKQLYALTF